MAAAANANRTNWNGMVDLSGITKNSPGDSGSGVRTSGQTGQSDLSAAGAKSGGINGGSARAALNIPEQFSRVINTTEMLPAEISSKLSTIRGISAQEKKLWHLTTLLLDDCNKNYDVEAVGVNSVPKSRHWHISQYRHAQHLLQSSKLLRRLNIVLRWLELTYDAGREQTVLNACGTPEQQQVLYQAVFDQVRGGQHSLAIQTASHATEHILETVLRSIGMLKAKEAFWKKTDRVELFGEYGISEEEGAKSVSNDHRKRLISQLYDESMLAAGDEAHSASSTAAAAFHTAIKGALSGNAHAMAKAFEQKPHWTNKLWCEIRSKLVHILLRTHQPFDVKKGAYVPDLHSIQLVQAIDRSCGETGSNWVGACEKAVEQDLLGETGLISELLRGDSSSSSKLDPIEALQLRVIQLFLSDAGIARKTKICSIGPHSPVSLRPHAYLLLLLDAAERSNYIAAPVQATPNLNQFAKILVSHCGMVLAENGASLDTGVKVAKFALPILRKIRDSETRACAYATLLGYVRRRAKNLLITESNIGNVTGAAASSQQNNDAIEREESDILTEIRITESSHYGSAALLDRVLELMSSNVGAFPITEVTFSFGQTEDGGAAGGSPFHAGGRPSSAGFNTTASIARVGGAEVAIVRPHEKAESVAWLAKTNDPANLQRVFDQAMDHNGVLWETEEYDAVRDIVSTLGSQVVPRIGSSSSTTQESPSPSAGHLSVHERRYFFWEAVVMCHELTREYVSTVQEMTETMHTVRKVRAQELTSKEARLRNDIREKMLQCLDNSSVMTQNVACAIASAIGDNVETARASLNILATNSESGEPADPSFLTEQTLQRCLAYIDRFKQSGRMQKELHPIHARVLMKKVHQLRVGLNLVNHIATVKSMQAGLQ